MTRSRDLANLADSTEFTAADNTKLDGIETSATADQTNAQIKTAVEAGADIALGGNPTTTTQSAGNNTTRVATTAFTQAAITALVDSSPASLNTLNELAAALGDDANFSTTVTNSIATKLPLAGGTITGLLTSGTDVGLNSEYLKLGDDTSNRQLKLTQYQTGGSNNNAGHKINASSGFGELALAVGGTNRLVATTTGVDIGTIGTSVASTLRLKSNSSHFAINIEENSGTEGWALGVDADGDLNFHNSGGSTPTVTFADSGHVSIGHASPTAPLDIRISGASGRIAEFHNTSGFGVDIGSDSNTVAYISGGYTQALAFKTNAGSGQVERMRLLANGDLRFGAGNSSSPLIQGTTNSGRTAGSPGYSFNDDINTGMFQPQSTTDTIAFSTGGTTRVQINSSGHLIVGSASHGDDNLYLVRSGTGKMLRLYSGSTEVGAMGSLNTNNLTISGTAADHGGLQFGTHCVLPMEANADSNGTITLGGSGSRFKDLFLSGGVAFGDAAGGSGTTSSDGNRLDSYEEGTFTPSFASGVSSGAHNAQVGYYTKIGRVVNFEIDIQGNTSADSGLITIGGLPFTSLNSNRAYGSAQINYQQSFLTAAQTGEITLHIGTNLSVVGFYNSAGNSFVGTSANNINARLIISGRYHTTS